MCIVSIASISPSIGHMETSVKGRIASIRPYSALNRTTSVLLVESDPSCRCTKSQIRVNFYGYGAEFLDRVGLIKNDEIILKLSGVRWSKAKLESDPMSIGLHDWELNFDHKVHLEVRCVNNACVR